jgi:hypothetical protein
MYAAEATRKFFHGPAGVPPGLRSVIVIESGEAPDADALMWMAFQTGAYFRTQGNDQVFWVVFPDRPDRAWDCTAGLVRQEMASLKRKLCS